jgi:hypothetical protein
MLGCLLGAPDILPRDQIILPKVEKATAALKEAAQPREDSAETCNNRWLPWQDNLLREMKAKNEPVPAIALAVEKTVSQVNSKWFQIKKASSDDDSDKGFAA